MIQRLDKHQGLCFLIIFMVIVVVGNMDYADAQLQEKTLCKRYPQPEFCK